MQPVGSSPHPAGSRSACWTAFFKQDAKVTVQLVNNQTATCWTSEFTSAKTNDGVQFKATAPWIAPYNHEVVVDCNAPVSHTVPGRSCVEPSVNVRGSMVAPGFEPGTSRM